MTPGVGLAALQAVALVAIGVGALVAPALSSRFYGIHALDPATQALIQALGIRDLVLGLALACALTMSPGPATGWMLFAMSLVAFADFAIVWRRAEAPQRLPLLLHGSGAVALVLAGILMLAN